MFNSLYLDGVGKVLALAGAIYCAKPFFTDFRAKATAQGSAKIEGATKKSQSFVATAVQDAAAAKDEPRTEDRKNMRRGMGLITLGFLVDAVVIGFKLLGWAA